MGDQTTTTTTTNPQPATNPPRLKLATERLRSPKGAMHYTRDAGMALLAAGALHRLQTHYVFDLALQLLHELQLGVGDQDEHRWALYLLTQSCGAGASDQVTACYLQGERFAAQHQE